MSVNENVRQNQNENGADEDQRKFNQECKCKLASMITPGIKWSINASDHTFCVTTNASVLMQVVQCLLSKCDGYWVVRMNIGHVQRIPPWAKMMLKHESMIHFFHRPHACRVISLSHSAFCVAETTKISQEFSHYKFRAMPHTHERLREDERICALRTVGSDKLFHKYSMKRKSMSHLPCACRNVLLGMRSNR